MYNNSDSDDEQYQYDLDIEFTPQEDLDLDPTSIPSQQPKWAHKLIKVDGDVVGNPDDRRRLSSQYQNDYVALSHTYRLLLERCFMMMGSYPQIFKEDFYDPRWQATMDEEFDFLQENKTWEFVTFPPRRKLVQCKWVYKTNLSSYGTITKYKGRLVAKGYSQVHGLDYNETFTPVARMESIRPVLEVAASKRWEVHNMDLKSVILHGDLKERYYMMVRTDP